MPVRLGSYRGNMAAGIGAKHHVSQPIPDRDPLVCWQVIEDHNIAPLEGRGQLGFDVGLEYVGCHGAVDEPGRGVTRRWYSSILWRSVYILIGCKPPPKSEGPVVRLMLRASGTAEPLLSAAS